MSQNEMVLQKLDSGLLTITMNRPDRRNALNPDMTRGLVEAARRAAEDHEVRAVLLKGAGGTFCVGGDVKSMAEGPTITLGYIKGNINNAVTMWLEECFDAEAIHRSRSGEAADRKEAAKAFVEKRKPVFRNH